MVKPFRATLTSALFATAMAVVVAGTGCNSIFGFEHGTHSEGGLPCSEATGAKSASCDDGFLCMFKTCEKSCAADSECQAGARCLNLSGGPGLGACATDGNDCDQGCPRNTACAEDGACRAICAPPFTAACQRDQECRGGFCFGTDPRHDPPPDAAVAADASTDGSSVDDAAPE